LKFTSVQHSRYQSPLARRLIVGIILFSSLITLILTVVHVVTDYHDELDDMEERLTQVENVHLRPLTQSLWATNSKELHLQLDGLVQTPDLEYAAVHEGDRLWSESGKQVSTNVIERKYPMVFDHQGVSRHIGVLTVRASLDNVYRRLLRESVSILLSNAIKTFFVAGFMFLFFSWLINNHLFTITGYLRVLDAESNAPPLALARNPPRTPDELDELVSVINRMHDKIRKTVQALALSERRHRELIEQAPEGIFVADPDGRYTEVNSAGCQMLGYRREELIGKNILDIIRPEEADRLQKAMASLRRGGVEVSEWELLNKQGVFLPVELSASILQDGRVQAFVRDIRDRKRLEEKIRSQINELEKSEELKHQLLIQARLEQARMTSLLSAMNVGILFADTNSRVVYFNPAFRRIWLIPESEDLTGHQTDDVMKLSANVLSRPDHFSRHILQVLGTHEVSETFEIVMADGRVITQLSYPVRDSDARYIGRLWVYEDVTRERQTAEQLIYLAERDSLTGLHNRHRFQMELGRMLADSERRQSKGALLFFDLDEFKYVNDTFGHRAGDSMLIRVAGEINAMIRRNEFISRIGGDEFAILLPDANEAEAVKLAERVIRAISQIPFRFEGQNLRLTTSLGIALYPQHGAATEELVSRADAAMYQAKEAGKNAWRIYRQDLDDSREMLTRLSWNDRLDRAFEKNLFVLHFQGVYHASDQQLAHLEALVRLTDETDPQRIIMPGHFIPTAERTGKILDIDRWVIRESIRLLKQHDHLPAIAVNISGRSFDEPTLPRYIDETLRHFQVEPRRLMVELTETSAVSDLHDAQRFIEALRQSGCRVCLDDFGTGFSSFAYLKHLKADILKIDGLFIRDLPNDHDNQVFVKSIADVARGMHKVTVAEFVEDAETLAMLRQFGVDMVQGYHLDMPRANHPALNGKS